jgi:IMP cyclohydrolase
MVHPEQPISMPWVHVVNINSNPSSANEDKSHCNTIRIDERSLGFLRFRTSSTHFDLKFHKDDYSSTSIYCDIYAPEEQYVGSISVSSSWASNLEIKRGEFILLSENIETPELKAREISEKSQAESTLEPTGEGHKNQIMYNIMLIDWEDGPQEKVAKRINITQIEKGKWLQAPLVQKTIVLH